VSRVFTGIVIALICAAMFIFPSAYLIAHGHSRWLALVLGGLAFPVVPGLWHGIGELRRRTAAPPKSTLTAWDRALLRGALVGAVAIGGTLLLARGTTWTVLKHGAWFTDWSEPDPIADSRLLAHVPAGAEMLIWIRPGHTHELLPMALSGDVEMVLVEGKSDTMLIMAGDDVVLEELSAVSRRGHNGDKLEAIDAPAGMRILATPGFREGGKPPRDLIDLLYRAPKSANAIAVGRSPSLETKYGARAFAAWAEVGSDHVTFTAEADAPGIVTKSLLERARTLAAAAAKSDDCGNRAFAKATHTDLYAYLTRIRGTAQLSLDVVREIPQCMISLGF